MRLSAAQADVLRALATGLGTGAIIGLASVARPAIFDRLFGAIVSLDTLNACLGLALIWWGIAIAVPRLFWAVLFLVQSVYFISGCVLGCGLLTGTLAGLAGDTPPDFWPMLLFFVIALPCLTMITMVMLAPGFPRKPVGRRPRLIMGIFLSVGGFGVLLSAI